MALVLDWQKKLGYTNDPFEGMPQPVGKHLVGLRDVQERLNLFLIKEERFGTISGDHGTGKTYLLYWMNEELAPQKSHTQQVVDGRMRRADLVNALLQARLSFFERKLGKKLKLPEGEKEKEVLQRFASESKNVLLVDNAGSLGKLELDLLNDIILKTPTYLIFADTEDKLRKLTLPDVMVDKLKIKTPAYTVEDLIALLQHRIESSGGSGTFPFDENELAVLIRKADKNPARLLSLARERAIELSLKVKELPAPVVVPQEKKHGMFSISVRKVEKSDTPEAPVEPEAVVEQKPILKPVPPVQHDYEEELPASTHEDMELLTKVIENANKPAEVIVVNDHDTKEKVSSKNDAKINRAIEHLAAEFKAPKKHAPKKKGKKR